MSLESWGYEILSSDEALTGTGQISIGKSRKGGENRDRTITINDRRLYQLQELLVELLGEPGNAYAKRGIALIFEDLRKAVAQSRRAEERDVLLRRHNIKPHMSTATVPGVREN